jgi:hypothetical protein
MRELHQDQKKGETRNGVIRQIKSVMETAACVGRGYLAAPFPLTFRRDSSFPFTIDFHHIKYFYPLCEILYKPPFIPEVSINVLATSLLTGTSAS